MIRVSNAERSCLLRMFARTCTYSCLQQRIGKVQTNQNLVHSEYPVQWDCDGMEKCMVPSWQLLYHMTQMPLIYMAICHTQWNIRKRNWTKFCVMLKAGNFIYTVLDKIKSPWELPSMGEVQVNSKTLVPQLVNLLILMTIPYMVASHQKTTKSWPKISF